MARFSTTKFNYSHTSAGKNKKTDGVVFLLRERNFFRTLAKGDK